MTNALKLLHTFHRSEKQGLKFLTQKIFRVTRQTKILAGKIVPSVLVHIDV